MFQPEARYYSITKTAGVIHIPSLSEAVENAGAQGYVWIDYCDPTEALLSELIPHFGIHPLSIEDCLNEEQLSKLDLYPEYSFMIFNNFETTPEELLSHELDVFISSKFLITSSFRNQAGIPLLQKIETSVQREIERVAQGPSFLMHLILDIQVDRKLETVEGFEAKLDLAEDHILSTPETFRLASLLNTRRDLQVIRKSLFHERELLGKLIRQDSPFIVEQSLVYFRDVYDHLSKYYEMSDTAREQVTSLLEIHLSMLNNQMALSANRTNKIIHRLTLITTIFMPLTLISGIGGMSEFTMMIGQENWRIGYPILIVVMTLIAVINYLMLLRMELKYPRTAKD